MLALLVPILALAGCTSLPPHRQAAPLPAQAAVTGGPRVDCATALAVGLRWDPAADANQVRGYQITRDGHRLGTSIASWFADTSVDASTDYSYRVAAITATGERIDIGSVEVRTPAASPRGDPPYCHSPVVGSILWSWRDAFHQANGSDLWSVTWAQDGGVYAFFGDGGGFGGTDHRGRASFGIARFTGKPPLTATTVRNVYGGIDSEHPSGIDGKASSLLAVGADFYAVGGIHGIVPEGATAHRSGSPAQVQLVYSRGNAHSWRTVPWYFCQAATRQHPATGRFCPVAFVNFGPGNSGAPDGEIYMLGVSNSARFWSDAPGSSPGRSSWGAPDNPPNDSSNDSSNDSPEDSGRTFLARVSRRKLLSRDAYRFFSGLDARGRPTWTGEARQMQPIFVDRNPDRAGCGGLCVMSGSLSDVVYDAGLHRFIGTAQGQYVGQTSFYDAPALWGPWTVLSYNNIDPADGSGGWAGLGAAGGRSLGVHPVNAWTSADGLTLWMTYSSDGLAPAGAVFPPAGSRMDSLNLVSARLVLAAPGDTAQPRADVR